VIRRRVRLIAVCLALVGQLVGAFGLPAARGTATTPEGPCGCSLADHTAGRCCCHHELPPPPTDNDLPPCCRAKKAKTPVVVWTVPNLRSKCQGPHDMVPESVVPASVPPEPPTSFTAPADNTGTVSTTHFHLDSRSAPPDVPPPRLSQSGL
jgi:hypothetical protein